MPCHVFLSVSPCSPKIGHGTDREHKGTFLQIKNKVIILSLLYSALV